MFNHWPFKSDKISLPDRCRQVLTMPDMLHALRAFCGLVPVIGLIAAAELAWWVFWTVPEDY